MVATAGFKQYQRGKRIQDSEEDYSKGMMFTNNPLQEGFSKVLINWDFKDGGANLTPRPALRPVSFVAYDHDTTLYSENMFVAANKECVEESGVTYQQTIIGDAVSNILHIQTTLPDTMSGFTGIPTNKGKITGVTTAKFKVPTLAAIHGMSISNTTIARHIGTFGFNNSYYFFTDIGLQQTKFSEANNRYDPEVITPRALTPKEAVMWGYNMLSSNPYTFANVWDSSGIPIALEGILPYDAYDDLVMSPKVNESIKFKCFGKGTIGKTYKITWEWKDAASSAWVKLQETTLTLAADTTLVCPWSAPDANIMLKLTAQNTTAGQEADLQVMVVGFNFKKDAQGHGFNAEQKTFDLRRATTMTYWQKRLVLSVGNTLFMSEVNDPSYFPYPNNVEIFDEQVIHITPFLDNLLVFTNTKLYLLTLSSDGLNFTRKCIQSNLDVRDWDIHLIRTVKNMVFFKSGNYYYMVVPKATSTTGELVIAPISKPIENLLDNFQDNVEDLLFKLYNFTGTYTLVHYYNYLDFEDVHNVYVFKTNTGLYVNVALLYNTLTRCWRMYILESGHFVTPAKQDATKKGTFVCITPTYINARLVPCVQLLKFNNQVFEDSYIPKNLVLTTELPADSLIFKNYQMLDTGYRERATDYKKRFREAQLKLNNVSNDQLRFYTEFMVDGETRRSLYRYEVHHEIDPNNPNYGLVTLDQIPIDPSILPGATILAVDQNDINSWTLDSSIFPEPLFWKIRIPFSGKGYAARMILISFNQRNFELLNNIWVYRLLNSR